MRMRETLAAWGVLRMVALMDAEAYAQALDALFLEHPEDEGLLELEFLPASGKDVLGKLLALAGDLPAGAEHFVGILVRRLEEEYRNPDRSLASFCRLAEEAASLASLDLQSTDPLCTLSCASEFLSGWNVGGEARLRDFLEETFRQYHPGCPPFAQRPVQESAPLEKRGWLRRLFRR